MRQFPIFLNLAGQPVLLVGEGSAADAKRRLYERAGARIVTNEGEGTRIAVVALDDDAQASAEAARLKAAGLLVNVVDRPELCDFTTPAIVDREPVLIAIGTGGASAGLAKHLRLRIEALLPATLGQLAAKLSQLRTTIAQRWPEPAARRGAIDAALAQGGALDPLLSDAPDRVDAWLSAPKELRNAQTVTIVLRSNDPDDLTLREARLLGQADQLFHDKAVAADILARVRADADIAEYCQGAECYEGKAVEGPGLTVILTSPKA